MSNLEQNVIITISLQESIASRSFIYVIKDVVNDSHDYTIEKTLYQNFSHNQKTNKNNKFFNNLFWWKNFQKNI